MNGSTTPERSAALLALALHAALLVLTWSHVYSRGHDTLEAPSQKALSDVSEIQVERETIPEPLRFRSTGKATEPLGARSGSLMARATDRSTGTTPPTATNEVPAPASSSNVLDISWGTWTFSPLQARGETDLSLGASRYRVPIPEEAQERGAPSANDPAKQLFAALTDHDVAIGLGRGGAVLHAVEEAAQASESGMLGIATFDVTLDHGGGVKVDLVHAQGDSGPWSQLRESIAQLVKKKSVRLPELGNGLRVRVQVEAAVKLADGRSVASLGNGGGATLGQVGTESVAMKEMPNVHVEHRGKICSARAAIGPNGGDLAASTSFGTDSSGAASLLPSLLTPFTLGGGCSPENIGIPARRVVAAREIRETLL